MSRKARNLADQFSGFRDDKKNLIQNRDPLFTKQFRQILRSAGIKPVRTLPMAPHLNGIGMHWNRTTVTPWRRW